MLIILPTLVALVLLAGLCGPAPAAARARLDFVRYVVLPNLLAEWRTRLLGR